MTQVRRLLAPDAEGGQGGQEQSGASLAQEVWDTPTTVEGQGLAQDSQKVEDSQPQGGNSSPVKTEGDPATAGGAKPQTKEEAPTPSPITPDAIAEAVARGMAASKPVEQTPPPRQLTQEEINEQLGVFKVTPEVASQLGLPPESAPVLDQVLQSVVKQAIRTANVLVQHERQELMNTLTPHISFAQQQRALMLQQQFESQYEHLKGYGPVVEAASKQLMESGFKGSTEEVMKKVAEGAEVILKRMNIDPKATKAGATAPASSKPKMSTVASGGGQGGAGAQTGTNKEPDWKDALLS